MTNSKALSSKRIARIREQGFFSYSDQEINDLAFGNRFAPRFCLAFLIPGVIFAHVPTLIVMNIIAVMSIFMTNHPFDYIYNYILRHWTKGPKLPPRSPQLKFACVLASLFIGSTIYFFMSGMMTAGYLMGLQVIFVASLVSLFDFCIPSKMFNFLSGKLGHSQA